MFTKQRETCVALLVVLFVLISVVLLACAGSEVSSTKAEEVTGPPPKASVSTSPSEFTLPQEVRNPKGWVFTIERIDLLETIDTSSERYRPETGVFLVMIGTVSNLSDKYDCINSRDFVLRNGAEQYEMSSKIVRAAQSVYRLDYPGFLFGQCLDPDETIGSYLVFDVPKDASDLWLQLKDAEIQIGQVSSLPATPIAVATPKPRYTPTYTPTPPLPKGTKVKLVGTFKGFAKVPLWYMYEDECEIDTLHTTIPSGTEAIIAQGKVCYARDYQGSRRSYYYEVEVPDVTHWTGNYWVNAKHVTAVSNTQGDTQGTIHIVQPGETLSIIAKKYDVTVETLVELNNIEDPNKITVGQKLIITAP